MDTVRECFVPDGLHGRRYRHVRQCGGTVQRIVPYAGDAIVDQHCIDLETLLIPGSLLLFGIVVPHGTVAASGLGDCQIACIVIGPGHTVSTFSLGDDYAPLADPHQLLIPALVFVSGKVLVGKKGGTVIIVECDAVERALAYLLNGRRYVDHLEAVGHVEHRLRYHRASRHEEGILQIGAVRIGAWPYLLDLRRDQCSDETLTVGECLFANDFQICWEFYIRKRMTSVERILPDRSERSRKVYHLQFHAFEERSVFDGFHRCRHLNLFERTAQGKGPLTYCGDRICDRDLHHLRFAECIVAYRLDSISDDYLGIIHSIPWRFVVLVEIRHLSGAFTRLRDLERVPAQVPCQTAAAVPSGRYRLIASVNDCYRGESYH